MYKTQKPPADIFVLHLRKALYLYVNEDITAKPTSPKFLRFRRLNSVFAMCDIVFMSIITNVAHRSFTSEYTKMRCKDTNFLSYKN